jgi:mRNA-degrading endonuclease RelE of RelBE toxin-antitoxin system
MKLLIADSFTDSLSRLTGDAQKATKTTAFDLHLNPANPGMSFHRLDRVKDKNFWSIRVSDDIRIIVHRSPESMLLCYVDHHDKAYKWAKRRKLETHPKTGAAQLVEIRETIKEVVIPHFSEETQVPGEKKSIFDGYDENQLLAYGVPQEWISDVQHANEDSLLELIDHLPSEAAEALLELATGGSPKLPVSMATDANPFDHPDAQRRFRVMSNIEELERALNFPWEKWTIFLHPEQRKLVENEFNGPARVSGSAGTGKTIVALHRAVHLAKQNPDARILLTTFSEALANALSTKLRRLVSNQPQLGERLEVVAIEAIGKRLHTTLVGRSKIATHEHIAPILSKASKTAEKHKFSDQFLWTEWNNVVDAWQLKSWEEYRDVRRLGRKTRLVETQRKLLWGIFKQVRMELDEQVFITKADIFAELAAHLAKADLMPFDYIVVDEAQDIGVPELRFLAAMGSGKSNGLFFAGDLGQRIFQQPFSWKTLGIDVRGRSQTLRINYRTSHQIRRQADRLLPNEMTDVDGNNENRHGTVSVFNGPAPIIQLADNENAEIKSVADWLVKCKEQEIKAHEIGVFVRSADQLARAESAVRAAGFEFVCLNDKMETKPNHVSTSTMHLAKGLEFRAVVVMACDDEVLPLQSRIESITDYADLEDTYNTERHLLYVACTRARDQLIVSGVRPGSEFLDDFGDA